VLIVDAEVEGRTGRAIRVEQGRVTSVGPADTDSLRPRRGEDVVDARGGLLLPGLHDHHIHLLALAATAGSVSVGPPAVRDPAGLAAVLRAAADTARGAWVRAVGYHESVAGHLDRSALDRLLPGVPVRVQHRSGALWVINSAGLAALRAAGAGDLPADGRLFRADDRLGRLLDLAGAGSTVTAADLAAVSARLARHGVTGVTDMTATTGPDQVRTLRAAVESGALRQRLLLTGPADLDAPAPLALGPVKVVLDDDVPLDLDALAATVTAGRARGRHVAFHCVTRAQLAFALAILDTAGGAQRGDRIEHAAVLPPDLAEAVAAAGLTVVTQPHFLAERGDAYLADVDPDDQPWLYRGAGALDAGIPLAAGTDAPFGGDDPWASMRAAVARRSPSGAIIGATEALAPARALALYLGDPADPGGPARGVTPGAPADLCLLAESGRAVVADLDPGPAVLTLVGGAVAHRAAAA
jgi:predicted amidohydrolase YtcJ